MRILGVPLDLGQSHRGVDMGPSAIRVAGLQSRLESLGHSVDDGGDLPVANAEALQVGDANAKYLVEITAACAEHAERVRDVLADGVTPLVLGGDHSVAAGTMAGVAGHFRKHDRKVGLVWFDAHTDINTPRTSPSGNVHGMPLAAVTGLGPAALSELLGFSPKVAPQNVVVVGVRDVDAAEKDNIRQSGIAAVYTMRDIDERGMRAVIEEALGIAGDGTAGYHVSLDMDWIDPSEAPGVGTPVRGGATFREAHLAMEIIADDGRMLSLEIVEVNPVIDERNRTAELAVELCLSAFGKKIL